LANLKKKLIIGWDKYWDGGYLAAGTTLKRLLGT